MYFLFLVDLWVGHFICTYSWAAKREQRVGDMQSACALAGVSFLGQRSGMGSVRTYAQSLGVSICLLGVFAYTANVRPLVHCPTVRPAVRLSRPACRYVLSCVLFMWSPTLVSNADVDVALCLPCVGVFYWTCCCYCCSYCCCCFGCCCCFWCWSNNICTHFERGWGQLRGARVWWPSSFVGCAISFFYTELPSFSLPTLELYSCPNPVLPPFFFSFTILPAFVLIFLRSLSFAAVATAHGKWNENRMILINLINRGAQPTAQLTIYSTLIVLYTRFQLVQSPPLLCCFRFCFDSLRFLLLFFYFIFAFVV